MLVHNSNLYLPLAVSRYFSNSFLGSQTGAQRHATLERLWAILPHYPEIVIWFDDPHQGQRLADRLAEAEPFRKEKVRVLASHSLDANELLRKGELLSYLAAHGITPIEDLFSDNKVT